jgi:hypothetical protein
MDNEWKRIQHSMALEGWGIPDKVLEQVALNYEAKGMDPLAREIAEQSSKTGESLSDVAKIVMDEFWKRKALFKRD